jgi:hypothetical protein
MTSDSLDDKTNSALNKANQYEREVLKNVFPHAHFSQSSVLGSAEREIKSFDGNISTGHLFQDTPYEFNGKNELLHFTSLNSLIQILRNGYFRMSDFNCLDDEEELNYSLKQLKDLKLDHDQIEEIKENLFCFSACESNDKTILNHFMWEVYADKGKGCAIEYKLTKNNPYQFLNGIVRYGENEFDELNTVLKLSEKFKDENNGFHAQDLPRLLTNILIFHKSKSYDIEDEVRMVYHRDGGLAKSVVNPHIYRDLYKNQKIRRFLKLFLKGKHPYISNDQIETDRILDIYPQIEINRIILGAKIKPDRIFDLIELLDELRKENDYDFEIWKMDIEKQTRRIG